MRHLPFRSLSGRGRQRTAGTILLAAWLLCPWSVGAASQPSRFYFSGDGVLELRSAHSDERIEVRYRSADGRYDPEALRRIEYLFRSRTDGRSGAISLRLIELLDFVEDRFRPRSVSLVSGYRSPEFNQALRDDGRRVAQASLHTEGLAADIAPAGLDLRRLWLQLRQLQVGGVGLYRADGFLHLDTGKPRFWEPATSGVESNLSAENARLFARTDFDRYDVLDGAVIRLHSVTALPIALRRHARLGEDTVEVVPRGEAGWQDDDCFVLREPRERYELTLSTPASPPSAPTPLRLETCAPRIGATPVEIVSNPIERLR